jgi:hypothetical protein
VLGGWTIVTFKTTGSGTITFSNISSPIEAKYLVVAGGGGGASLFGAGGAGGFREGKQNISSSSYSVTVGAGGAGALRTYLMIPTLMDPMDLLLYLIQYNQQEEVVEVIDGQVQMEVLEEEVETGVVVLMLVELEILLW